MTEKITSFFEDMVQFFFFVLTTVTITFIYGIYGIFLIVRGVKDFLTRKV
jgi:hypothetical protein